MTDFASLTAFPAKSPIRRRVVEFPANGTFDKVRVKWIQFGSSRYSLVVTNYDRRSTYATFLFGDAASLESDLAEVNVR